MRSSLKYTAVLVPAAAAALVASSSSPGQAGQPTFSHPRTIDNPYLPITAHRRCEFRGRGNDGTRTRDVLSVLGGSKRFQIGGQGVDAVVVRDNAYEDGELVESTRDYYAQADDGTVHYLGEQVNNIRNGKVVDHRGSWLYGRDTDVLGVAMPADPKLDTRYRLEDVPGITAESDRVEETGARAQVAGRLHTGVIRTSEFIQPEGEVEYKLYAPGVGTIVEYEPEGSAELVGCR